MLINLLIISTASGTPEFYSTILEVHGAQIKDLYEREENKSISSHFPIKSNLKPQNNLFLLSPVCMCLVIHFNKCLSASPAIYIPSEAAPLSTHY